MGVDFSYNILDSFIKRFISGDVPVSTGEVVAEKAGRVGASPLKRRKRITANDNYAFAA